MNQGSNSMLPSWITFIKMLYLKRIKAIDAVFPFPQPIYLSSLINIFAQLARAYSLFVATYTFVFV